MIMKSKFDKYKRDPEINKFYKTYKWKMKRKEILERDNYECQHCKAEGLYSKAQCVHHIKELKYNPLLAFDNDNLISLCNTCHNKIHDKGFNCINHKKIQIEERW